MSLARPSYCAGERGGTYFDAPREASPDAHHIAYAYGDDRVRVQNPQDPGVIQAIHHAYRGQRPGSR